MVEGRQEDDAEQSRIQKVMEIHRSPLAGISVVQHTEEEAESGVAVAPSLDAVQEHAGDMDLFHSEDDEEWDEEKAYLSPVSM